MALSYMIIPCDNSDALDPPLHDYTDMRPLGGYGGTSWPVGEYYLADEEYPQFFNLGSARGYAHPFISAGGSTIIGYRYQIPEIAGARYRLWPFVTWYGVLQAWFTNTSFSTQTADIDIAVHDGTNWSYYPLDLFSGVDGIIAGRVNGDPEVIVPISKALITGDDCTIGIRISNVGAGGFGNPSTGFTYYGPCWALTPMGRRRAYVV